MLSMSPSRHLDTWGRVWEVVRTTPREVRAPHQPLRQSYSTTDWDILQLAPIMVACCCSSVLLFKCDSITHQLRSVYELVVLGLEVSDRLHLSKILRKIRTSKSIVSVTRIHDHEMREAKALH